jgi:hypothetical protein
MCSTLTKGLDGVPEADVFASEIEEAKITRSRQNLALGVSAHRNASR